MNTDIKFSTTPKIFTDYRRYIKDSNGVSILDIEYDYNTEISKQIELMQKENITI